MATLSWKDGNQAFNRMHGWDQYEISKQTATRFELTYDEAGEGPVDESRSAYRIEFIVRDGELKTPTEGPNAGEPRYSEGTLRAVKFYDKAGNVKAQITDLTLSMPLVFNMTIEQIEQGSNGNNVMKMIRAQVDKYIGSNDSMAPDGWDGDDIQTGVGNDTVTARGGDDFITDGGGADVYNGGEGWDIVSYDDWFWNPAYVQTGVNVHLGLRTATGPDGFVDTLNSISEVRGTFLADTMQGNGGDNSFMGMQGADILNGGLGFDRVDYRNDHRQGGEFGVNVNLGKGSGVGQATDGFGDTDTLINIENVRGSIFRDIIRDNFKDNRMEGREGNDVLIASRGNDRLEGDQGADKFQFLGNNFGNDTISDFDDTEGDSIRIYNANSMADLTISQNGSSAMIEFGANTIELWDFDSADLTVDDFIF